MLHPVYEGTPNATIPVAPLTFPNPVYWESGVIGMLNSSGQGVPSDGTAAFGVIADRRSPYPGISIANFLPAVVNDPNNAAGYGDEFLFNQPGHGNALFGTLNGVNNIYPSNARGAMSNLPDETSVNPNLSSRYVTMYTRGGEYATDQFDLAPGTPFVAGGKVYVMNDGTGRITSDVTHAAGTPLLVGTCTRPDNGYGFVQFKSLIL